MSNESSNFNITFILLRHGQTRANKEKRYSGRTDYPLNEEGKKQLLLRNYSAYKDVQKIFVSPLLRCRQSADIIFPEHEKTVIADLIECDFGDFEDKNYIEMAHDPAYQAWVDSKGTLPFPNGEDVEAFKDRCARAMKEVIDICTLQSINKAALVIHGGVIMSIMERLCTTKKAYYEWQPQNGCGYIVSCTSKYNLIFKDSIEF